VLTVDAQIFYRMGFNDQEIVALAGAHALGRCHTDRSGFDGPWTFSPITFSNQYFDLLANEKWIWRKWDGPKQLTDKKTGTLMMLPYATQWFQIGFASNCWPISQCCFWHSRADYALIQDKAFKKYVQAYAKDENLFFKECVYWSVFLHDLSALMRLYSFSAAFARLLELGVPTQQFVTSEPWIMGEPEKKD
jgi:cytochrome c peroxidase